MQIISAVLGGTVAALLGNSGINMYQTYSLASAAADQQQHKTTVQSSSRSRRGPIISQYISSSDGKVNAPTDKSVDEIVSDLKQLKRSDFVALWLGCEAPSTIKDVDGDWNGVLLDNSGLTSVSNILTDVLFGWRHGKWNGKAFDASIEGGTNRFFPKSGDGEIEREHKFDCKIDTSLVHPNTKSLNLLYADHQSRLSLWHTMRDEIRVLRLSGNKGSVLLGLGCMKWSGAYWRGGMMNSSPFCLWRG
mmetsp:Transcript_317/g.631  ORF Transcript_317/g.631 Transcript_317/m.631 type:complete len:248 (-) Transcript_317:448-1191(-)